MVVIGPRRNTLARLDDLKATRAALLLAGMDGQSRIFIPYRGRVRAIDVPAGDELVATIEALEREIAFARLRHEFDDADARHRTNFVRCRQCRKI